MAARIPGGQPWGAAVRLLLAAMLFFPSLAHAHAILVDSAPPLEATIPPGVTRLLLRFNSRIDHARSRLILRQNQSDTALPLDPAAGPDLMTATATVAPGAYTLRWQVLALDGHVTRGDVPFTVRAP